MAEYVDREHFIPLRVSELIDWLCQENGPDGLTPLSREDQRQFRHFARMIQTHYHQEYYRYLERLKDAYAPFDPDSDTVAIEPIPDEEVRQQRQDAFFKDISGLLERGNYKRLSRSEIERIMEGASDWGLEMAVDWDVFDRLEVYYRGDIKMKRPAWKIWHFWTMREKTVEVFKRLVVVLKQTPHRRLGKDADTQSIFLKLFKDMPQMDLEMVLPGTRILWSKLDKALVVYPVAMGIGIAVYKLMAQLLQFKDFLSVGVGALASWGFVAALGGYGYRSYYSYTVKKTNYRLQLTQSLYYQNMGGNAGVLYRLLDDAEEQECREAMLGYFYLWRYAGQEGWTAESLDDYIEMELERRLNLEVDFEIEDALDKLDRLGLAQKVGDRYRVIPIDQAIHKLEALHAESFAREGTKKS